MGGASEGTANAIAFNLGPGVEAHNLASDSTGNRILSNPMFSNLGLGIDLGADGPTANDPKDPDTGPNNLQNFPVLTDAPVLGNQVMIRGTLNSTPSTKHKNKFTIQFFSSPLADTLGGEGKTFLGQKAVTTDRQDNASFSTTFSPSRFVSPGEVITATATDTKATPRSSRPS